MWVRNSIFVAATIAAITFSWASPAQAQGPAPAVPLPAQVRSEHVFTPPVVLGPAWAQAVRTLVEGVKQIVDKDRLQTERAVCPIDPPSGATEGPRAQVTARPVVPAWQATWMPAAALRETLGASPIQVGPVGVAPPAEAGRDTRGEHAVLLGARMHLPWMVP